MKAKIILDERTQNRQELHKLIPLKAPLHIHIDPSGVCDLRCNFCDFTMPTEKFLSETGRYHSRKIMSRQTMGVIAEQIKNFSQRIKTISYFGTGEPLMNKEIPFMLSEVYKNKLAEKQFFSTNGVKFTKEMAEALINATNGGNDLIIKISANGFSNKTFRDITGVEVDFNKYIKQLEYLYKIKKNARIIVKAVTTSLGVAKISKEDFYSIYGDVCDELLIENTEKHFDSVEYKGIIDDKRAKEGTITDVKVCPLPFYKLTIFNDGTICIGGASYCNNAELRTKNVNDCCLVDVWNGSLRKTFLKNLLERKFDRFAQKCEHCVYRVSGTKYEYLDPYADEIYERLLKMWGEKECQKK